MSATGPLEKVYTMANDERDRWGEKLKDSERAREEQYFAEQQRKLIEKMRQRRCPSCEAELPRNEHDQPLPCPQCGPATTP